MNKSYFRKVHAVVFLYDSTDEQSLIDARDWVAEFFNMFPRDKFVIVLAGTKSDLKKEPNVELSIT